ncbi:MAG: flavodoxin family protein [Sedimentisphaerales bacterium]|nr:flavodoxin family protein [Sedimentisphaerales bacterium]
MIVKTLGISTSPRLYGNSDLLLREALSGAESAGAHTEYIHLPDYDIAPCLECNTCYSGGNCKIQDDFQELIKKILEVDRFIFATPVFFMSVCAQAKIFIDRSQCLWAYKYILNKQLFDTERDRRAMVIAVGGSKSKKQFESIRLTMKTYFDVLDMNYSLNLFINKVDDFGEINKQQAALKEAFRLGKELTIAESPPPQKPVNIEII